MNRLGIVLGWAVLASCAAPRWVVRLEAPEGEQVVHVPVGESRVIEMGDVEFREAVKEAARSIPRVADPLAEAERLFDVGEQRGSFLYEMRSKRLTQIGGTMIDPGAAAAEALTQQYLKWCEAAWGGGDCLGLLKHSKVLTPHGRYVLTWQLSKHSVLDATRDSLKDLAKPQEIAAMLSSAVAMYMLLWVLPEPASKGLAAALTFALIGYVGWDLITLADAFSTMVQKADEATTFEELQAAAHVFGERAGKTAARVAVLVVSYMIGRGLPSRGAKLPGFAEADAQAARLTGVGLGGVGAVQSVVVGHGVVSIGFATSLAMVGNGSSGSTSVPPEEWTPPEGGPGKWIRKLEAMFPRARKYQKQVTGTRDGWTYRVTRGKLQADFDGYRDGVLIEAKGPGYADLLKKDPKQDWLQAFKQMVNDAKRQQLVAPGARIEWRFAEQGVADFVRSLFEQEGLQIKVVHTPPTGGVP